MITSTQTSTGDVWTYTYNFRDLMTGTVEKNSSGTILAQVTYTYDALDNRIGMDENGTQTWTLSDGPDPVMDFNGSGSVTMRYLNGPTGDLVDTVLARESAGGTIAWYLPDRLGTVRDLVNNSGSIIDHVDYSAFGTVLDESSPSNGDRMMSFAGMERDTVTGLNLAVNRVQIPRAGRWTSQDPKRFASGDVNLYRYAKGDPVNQADPSGLACVRDPSKKAKKHRSNTRPSNEQKHEKGERTQTMNQGGDKKRKKDDWQSHKKIIPDAPPWALPVGCVIVIGVGVKIGAGILTIFQPETAPVTIPIIIAL